MKNSNQNQNQKQRDLSDAIKEENYYNSESEGKDFDQFHEEILDKKKTTYT